MTGSGLEIRVERFLDRIRREDVNMHGWMLSVDGKRMAEVSYAPFRLDEPHRMYSVSKTMVALAVGLLIDEGKLRLEDHIIDYFRDLLPEQVSPYLEHLVLRDMLRMATCYSRTAYREYEDEDWTKPFFTGQPDHEPGTVFCYDTGCSQVLASLVRRLTGKEVVDFLEERLFVPLGLLDQRYWLRDPSGQCTGGTGLCMSLRDLHRVALCLIRGGEGLLPAWFVAEMQKKQIETLNQANEEEQYGYGWQCWRTRAGWVLYGLGGQLAILCPEKNAVMCTIADVRLDPCGLQRIYDAFFEELYPWLGKEEMEELRLTMPAPVLASPAKCGIAPDTRYVFPEGNALGIHWLKMQENGLIYENGRGVCHLPFHPGETIRASYPGWAEVPATVSAGWAKKGLLRVRCYAIGDSPCGFDMLLSFREDTVTLLSRRSHDPLTNGYEGTASGKRG